MLKSLKFMQQLLFVGFIYILGLLYYKYILVQLMPLLLQHLNKYLALVIQLIIFSVFPLIIGILIRNNSKSYFLSSFVIGLSCVIPFIFFSNSLYFITHPFQCNPSEKSLIFITLHLLIATICILIIVIAIRKLPINLKQGLWWSVIIFYIFDLLLIQGWFFFFIK